MVAHPNRRRVTKEAPVSRASSKSNHDYSGLLTGVRASFTAAVGDNAPVFATDADDLYAIYLDALPSQRQVHNCHCCHSFIKRYGGLVTLSEDGEIIPVMWIAKNVPDFYSFAFEALAARVKRSRIESPFYGAGKYSTWGTPETGEWSHISVVPPSRLVCRNGVLSASQKMAADKENYRTVITALKEFSAPMLEEAIRILSAGAMARSERFVGPVKWLRSLHDRPKGRKGENVLWRAIALAPQGYCHPRASVVGTLLEDIAAGLAFDDIKARFEAKVAPLMYQRPQVSPSAGNIKAAEALVEKMGIAPSLERRFARIEELQTIWMPKDAANENARGGIFGHLSPKNGRVVYPVDLPASTVTWEKFARTILAVAQRLEIMVPSVGQFLALTTAVNADAPPILKWDRDDARNPVAWYVYPNGSPAHQWNLQAGRWATITAIAPFPNLWGSNAKPYLTDGVILTIDGAVDTRTESGNALFPECLRDELHSVRSTIEAYSRSAALSGRENASACGYDLRKASCSCRLRAFVNGAWTEYHIDRWD